MAPKRVRFTCPVCGSGNGQGVQECRVCDHVFSLRQPAIPRIPAPAPPPQDAQEEDASPDIIPMELEELPPSREAARAAPFPPIQGPQRVEELQHVQVPSPPQPPASPCRDSTASTTCPTRRTPRSRRPVFRSCLGPRQHGTIRQWWPRQRQSRWRLGQKNATACRSQSRRARCRVAPSTRRHARASRKRESCSRRTARTLDRASRSTSCTTIQSATYSSWEASLEKPEQGRRPPAQLPGAAASRRCRAARPRKSKAPQAQDTVTRHPMYAVMCHGQRERDTIPILTTLICPSSPDRAEQEVTGSSMLDCLANPCDCMVWSHQDDSSSSLYMCAGGEGEGHMMTASARIVHSSLQVPRQGTQHEPLHMCTVHQCSFQKGACIEVNASFHVPQDCVAPLVSVLTVQAACSRSALRPALAEAMPEPAFLRRPYFPQWWQPTCYSCYAQIRRMLRWEAAHAAILLKCRASQHHPSNMPWDKIQRLGEADHPGPSQPRQSGSTGEDLYHCKP